MIHRVELLVENIEAAQKNESMGLDLDVTAYIEMFINLDDVNGICEETEDTMLIILSGHPCFIKRDQKVLDYFFNENTQKKKG